MIFFKKVKIIDFLNDNIKLNFAREIPKDKRTQGKAMSYGINSVISSKF